MTSLFFAMTQASAAASAASAVWASPVTMDELSAALTHPQAWLEVLALLACLGGAWAVARVSGGQRCGPQSIAYGRRIFDGVLFPVLALTLAFVARHALAKLGLPLALIQLVIAMLMALALIRLTVRVLSVVFPNSRTMRVVERTFSWLAWAALVGWVTGVLPELRQELGTIHWQVGGTSLSLLALLDGLLSAGFMLVVVLWVSKAIEARLLKGVVGARLSLRLVVANTVRVVLLFIGVVLALSAVGIDLTALSVLGGAIGVGIGLGLQKVAANYVSGFVILAERSVRIGDLVRVAGHEGHVTGISTRYTVVRAGNGVEAIVPNEMFITQVVENLSLTDSRVQLKTAVSVGYGTDLTQLLPQLVALVASVERVLSEPAPTVLLEAFGADGLDLAISFWIADPDNGQGNVRSAVNLAILGHLNAQGVDIPYPQRVVHLPQGEAGLAPHAPGAA